MNREQLDAVTPQALVAMCRENPQLRARTIIVIGKPPPTAADDVAAYIADLRETVVRLAGEVDASRRLIGDRSLETHTVQHFTRCRSAPCQLAQCRWAVDRHEPSAAALAKATASNEMPGGLGTPA